MDKFIIETSARHVHVSQEALETLFGKGYALTPKKDLSQPGQFACEERVAVVGSKGQFPAVSILGPTRPASQVEISASDARSIGCVAPVRESGDTAGSGACKLVGPKGEVELSEGAIVAKRKPGKDGKFRQYLRLVAIPLGISTVICFLPYSDPNSIFYNQALATNENLLFAVCIITYLIYCTMYTAMNIPFGSLASVITDDP
jgi:hypothetical protein